jgi:hypothetical protein
MRYIILLASFLAFQACSGHKQRDNKAPNLLFIMMDDLGYGHFGPNNAALTVDDFNPWFVRLVKEKQDYSPEQALAFSKSATPTLNRLAREGILFTNVPPPGWGLPPACSKTGWAYTATLIARPGDWIRAATSQS